MDAETVTVEVRGLGGVHRLNVAAGAALLEAFLAAGVGAPHRCRRALCGRCRVFVASGAVALEPVTEAEGARLGAMAEAGMRLLCQARVRVPAAQSTRTLCVEY